MAFVRARTAFGGHHIVDSPPRISEIHNAVIHGWAVYDDRRLLVPDSAFTREGIEGGGPGLSIIGAGSTMNFNSFAASTLPSGEYIWIGCIHDHFGHFLISTLSRLWVLSRYSPNAKLVTACPGDLARRLRVPFIADIMDALGLSEDRFVQVEDYTVVPTLTVPEALFIENSSVNQVMSDFCCDVADRILARDGEGGARNEDVQSDQPLFLTKRKVQHGVRTIVNEGEFADHLEEHGMVVASPETLTLAEQIRLWRRHTLIAAFEGSSLHAAIFTKNKKILSISTNASASSNQVLINAVSGHQALYLNSNGAMVEAQPEPGFQLASRLTDPDQSAKSLLHAVEYLSQSDECMRMRSMRDTVSPWLFIDEPFGSNLSRGKSADMSSADPNWATDAINTSGEAAGAVSGRLSGRYQFHSRPETAPWWQVDLGQNCLVTEVRVFNRNDVAQYRARNIILWCSVDGTDWTRLHQREETGDYGGGRTPRPWRWWQDIPFEARFVRLGLEMVTPEFFHLDQVEVFGLPRTMDSPISFG